MTVIRPVIGAAKNYTAGKLVEQLKKREIPYKRTFDGFRIGISFRDAKDAKYEYIFDGESLKLMTKKKTFNDGHYITEWKDGFVSFVMQQGEKLMKITKSVTRHEKDVKTGLFKKDKKVYTLTEINKSITDGNIASGWTRRVHELPEMTMVDVIPHRTVRIIRNQISTRLKNVTEDVVDKVLASQLKMFK